MPDWGIAGVPVLAVRVGVRRHRGHFLAEMPGVAVQRGPVGLLGVHAHGIDGTVHADAGGEPAQGGHRVLLVEVDHLRALLAGHAQAILQVVDGVDLAGASSMALAMANWPTGPQPNTATVSPGLISASSAPK